MPRIVHFENAYDDPIKAAEFYKNVFGWEAKSWESGEQPYWLITTGPDGEMGINGGFMKKMPNMPNVVNTIGVDDIDTYLKKVTDMGGRAVSKKMEITGMGWVIYCLDPGGVTFGLFQPEMSAK
jgi:uncharacterized protein